MLDGITQIRNNIINDLNGNFPPIFIVAIVGFIIQFIKIIIDSIKEKRFCIDHIFISGGFPSFHTGVATSVTILALLIDGIGSISFAAALTFSTLFAYDAMNVRYQTGKHAEYLNDIRRDLQENFLMTQQRKTKLKERLGHTPKEVLGGFIFGAVLTFVLYCLRYV